MPKPQKIPPRFIYLAIASLIVLGGSVYTAYGVTKGDGPDQPAEITTPDGEKIVVETTTEVEAKETEEHKKDLAQDNSQKPASSPSLVITEANGSVVRFYVNGVFEDGGTCTATATQGPQTVTRTSTGFKNVSYTQCPPIQWNLPSGSWEVVVKYKSDTADVSRTIEIMM